MARQRDESGRGVGYVFGMLLGGAVGMMGALLFAPTAGWELRDDLTDGFDALIESVKDPLDGEAEMAAAAIAARRRVVAEEVIASGEEPKAAVEDVARLNHTSGPVAP